MSSLNGAIFIDLNEQANDIKTVEKSVLENRERYKFLNNAFEVALPLLM